MVLHLQERNGMVGDRADAMLEVMDEARHDGGLPADRGDHRATPAAELD
jgi:hypothetical protein